MAETASAAVIAREHSGRTRSNLHALLCALVLAALALPAAGCLKYQQGRVDYGSEADTFVEIDGQRIRVFDAGEGDVVLFIHGFGSFIEAWSLVMPAFREQGYRVVALDLPGFGKSDKINRDYSPHGLAVTVYQVMKKLGIDKAHVVAHSWGCSVALALARYRPMHVGRLVLTGAWVFDEQLPPFVRWARVPGVGEMIFAWTYKELVAQKIALSFYDPEAAVDQHFVDSVDKALDRPGVVAAALSAMRAQHFKGMEHEYARITHKTLLVWGREDEVSRPLFGEMLASILPDSRLVLIPRCGHIPQVESPAQFSTKVLEFLKTE
jgi:pimeloyl-ACP methyl ester carboxylesterase